MKKENLVARHTSTSSEHYTPKAIVEAARALLGKIDLDPASCAKANSSLVKADLFFSPTENGFTRPWYGNVFLNPPGGSCSTEGVSLVKHPKPSKGWFLPSGEPAKGQSSQKAWWFKLAREWVSGRVRSAVFICFSIELLQTTQTPPVQGLTPLDFPICFPKKRIDYLSEDENGDLKEGGGPPHASCIVYLPPPEVLCGETQEFFKIFSPIGRIVIPHAGFVIPRIGAPK